MSTRTEKKAATRAHLLRAASGCFASSGYGGTSIGAITKAAGVAHGTFYVHFPSKEALLDELLDDFNRTFTHSLTPVLAQAQALPMDQLLQRAAEVFLDHWFAHRGFVEAYAQRIAGGLSLAAMRDGLRPSLLHTLAQWWRELTASQATPLEAELLTQALAAMWFRVGLQYLYRDDVSREQCVALLVKLTSGAVSVTLSDAHTTRSTP